MTDRKPFEVRFGAAVHAYVGRISSDLDPADLAHRIAAKGPRRDGLAATLAWRGVAVPRRLWVLLLLAGLLAAMVGGMLLAGSQPVRRLPAILPPVGQLFACLPGSTPDVPGPIDQPRPPMSYVAPMAFERREGRIVLLAGDPPGTAQTWTFNVCTNTWTQMHPNREPPAWSALVYDVDSDVTIAFDRRNAWAYDPGQNTWTMKAGVSIGTAGYPRLVYDPVSGLVVLALVQGAPATDSSELWTYDVETDAWAAIVGAGPSEIGRFGGHAVVAYDGAVDRLVFYEPEVGTALFDLRARTWSNSHAAAPNVGFGWGPSGGEIVYDGAIGRTIVSSYGRVAAYDAVADSWDVLVDGRDPDAAPLFSGPTCRSMPWIVYDPINDRLVLYGGQYPTGVPPTEASSGWVQSDDVLAFDPATRAWTTLLAASRVQPPPH